MIDTRGLKERLIQSARHGLNNHDASTLMLVFMAESLERMEDLMTRMASLTPQALHAEPPLNGHHALAIQVQQIARRGPGRPPKHG